MSDHPAEIDEQGPMAPGGPLCGCDSCEVIRERYGVEELTPDMLAESERAQGTSGAPPH